MFLPLDLGGARWALTSPTAEALLYVLEAGSQKASHPPGSLLGKLTVPDARDASHHAESHMGRS